MKLPIWLYEKRTFGSGLRDRRWGGCYRHFTFVLSVLDGGSLARSWIFSFGRSGRFGIQYGPEGGVEAGCAELLKGSRVRFLTCPHGKALAFSYAAEETP